MSVLFDHSRNVQTLSGARAAMPVLFGKGKPASLLDVGCGTGTWLRAAADYGIEDVLGVDGVRMPPDGLHVGGGKIGLQDLTKPWNVGRRFETVLCLEVGEHLAAEHAPTLVESLVKHGDTIYFSAACPGQPGQHHVNCRWPEFWQGLFNQNGFSCSDHVRWEMWDNEQVEPWYRQNIFVAKNNPEGAGHESRIRRVIHPDCVAFLNKSATFALVDHVRMIERGLLSFKWYAKAPVKAVARKLARGCGLGAKAG